jgi:hypothetical protein
LDYAYDIEHERCLSQTQRRFEHLDEAMSKVWSILFPSVAVADVGHQAALQQVPGVLEKIRENFQMQADAPLWSLADSAAELTQALNLFREDNEELREQNRDLRQELDLKKTECNQLAMIASTPADTVCRVGASLTEQVEHACDHNGHESLLLDLTLAIMRGDFGAVADTLELQRRAKQ